jgi:hypothetical protein
MMSARPQAVGSTPTVDSQMPEEINHDRRRFLGAAVMTIAAAELSIKS